MSQVLDSHAAVDATIKNCSLRSHLSARQTVVAFIAAMVRMYVYVRAGPLTDTAQGSSHCLSALACFRCSTSHAAVDAPIFVWSLWQVGSLMACMGLITLPVSIGVGRLSKM